ncbi:MAG: family 43 glycosylhydrolase [Solirubrobacterales bacterium]|nr:family 43 glycosylhydrolase [Solirubrobacterales bacterium]
MRRRWPLAGVCLVLLGALLAVLTINNRSPAGARAARPFVNPMRDGLSGSPLSCPDPSVTRRRDGRWFYVLVCTSDNNRNAFPIYRSEDLVHWYPDGFVFPHGRQPWWAAPSTGGGRAAVYWGPALYRIDNRWVLYFSADYDAATHAAGSFKPRAPTMVLGVAAANSLRGPWRTKLLHFPGELNAENRRPDQEVVGGDIDPGVVDDPRTGRMYLFWAEQREQIWEAELSGDGLTLGPEMRLAFGVSRGWECDPANRLCTVEGPQPFYHDGKIFVLYSAASTWDSSYAVGVAAASRALDPATPFRKLATPILRSSSGFLGPGGESNPVLGPDGSTMIMYHALTHPILRHDSGLRVLMLGELHWVDGWPLIDEGLAQ